MTDHEPYRVQKSGNDKQDTKDISLKINSVIENMILNNPSQWIWSHNRWK